jgi:glycosyltransferase involved in cell wall biosynthesis
MKHILIILPDDHMGGAEQYLKMVSDIFHERGYMIYVFFLKKKMTGLWENKSPQNTILYYTYAKKEKIGLAFLIYNILRKRKVNFEYVFTSHVHCSALVGIFRYLRILKINQFVARESTSIFKRFSGIRLFRFKILYRLGYLSIDLLICQTEYMKKQLIIGLPWLEKKIQIKVIPNPVNMRNIFIEARKNFNLNIEKPYIVSAGRLIQEKGFDILVKSFVLLKQNHADLKLVILGEGKQRKFLIQLIKDLKLENDVFLYGFVKNIYPCFREAQMCVVSSRIEGFPNVLLQMMSQNDKVVSALCAGGIEKIQGLFTCQTDDEKALFIQMDRCLHSDTKINRQLFDNELQNRSVEKFIDKVNEYLQNRNLFNERN